MTGPPHPSAVSALASLWVDAYHPRVVTTDRWWKWPRSRAKVILTHPFTPAQRAAIAAELLTPEVLAEALAGTGTYDFSTPRKHWNPLYQPFMNAYGARILTALRDAGKEPSND